MANPTNREEFKDYCLRRLGAPLQYLPLDDDQVEDRIDDALEYFKDYHYDSTEKLFYKHQVTALDITNGYLTIPEQIVEIIKVLPGGIGGVSGTTWMTPQYQITFDAVMNLGSASILPYYIGMSHLAEINYMFDSTPTIQFRKHTNQLHINVKLGTDILEGQWIAFEAFGYIDPEIYADVWGDRWLKRYASALIKKQWAENAKLFGGVQILGGVTLDAQTAWQEADSEITAIEQEMLGAYSQPPWIEIG